MGRIFGLAMMVIGVWIALTLYREGIEGAFGGALGSGDPAAERPEPVTRAVERITEAAHRAHEDRMNRQLE